MDQLTLLHRIDRFGRLDHAEVSDLIIVLGAGFDADGRPSKSMKARATHAASLYHEGYAEQLLCSGGFTRPDHPSEAAVCAQLLMAAGVPDPAIAREEKSHSTQENAIHSTQWMHRHSQDAALVVSSSYHLWRARWLFRSRGVEVGTSPAPGGYLTPVEYLRALLRESWAMNWHRLSDAFGLPWTDFPLF